MTVWLLQKRQVSKHKLLYAAVAPC